MKYRPILLIIVMIAGLLLTATSGRVRAQTLSGAATLETDSITTGEAVRLSIEAKGTTLAEKPVLTSVDGLAINYMGPDTQVQFINGEYSAAITYNYEIVGLKPGTYTLGPFEIKIKNEKIVANAVTLQVDSATNSAKSTTPVGNGSSPLGDKLFMEMELGKSKLFLGERTPVKIRVYASEVTIDEMSYPVLNQPEFMLDQMDKPSQRKTVINGRSYNVVEFSSYLNPVKIGRFVLGPARLNCTVLIKTKARDPFFSDFFPDLKKYPVELKSNNININVAPLPSTGKPNKFSGGIGRFQIEVTGQPTEVLQGEPVTLKLTVTGNGNLQVVKAPYLSDSQGLKVYDPQKKNPSSKGETGQVQFEQVVIPIDPQLKQLGPFKFSYFDPYQGSYRQAIAPAIPLKVKPNPDFKAVLLADTKTTEEDLGKDLVFIKSRSGGLKRRKEQLIYQNWFWALQFFPIIGLISAFSYRKYRNMLGADSPRSRALRAGNRATKLMAKAKEELADEKLEATLEILHLIIREYLGEKYKLTIAGMTGSVVGQIAAYEVNPQTLQEIHEFFEQYDYHQFTGSKIGLTEAHQLWEKVNKIIKALENSGNQGSKKGKTPERRDYNGKS